jgi:hypothetical protein
MRARSPKSPDFGGLKRQAHGVLGKDVGLNFRLLG